MTRWVDDAFPGWIEVQLVTADGRSQRIIEKVPVLTAAAISATSAFPQELWVRGTSIRVDDESVEVTLGYGAVADDDSATLTFSPADVVWL